MKTKKQKKKVNLKKVYLGIIKNILEFCFGLFVKKRKRRGEKQLLQFSFRSQYCFLCCYSCLLHSNRDLFALYYSTVSVICLISFKNLYLLKSIITVSRTSLFYRLFQFCIAQSLTNQNHRFLF